MNLSKTRGSNTTYRASTEEILRVEIVLKSCTANDVNWSMNLYDGTSIGSRYSMMARQLVHGTL